MKIDIHVYHHFGEDKPSETRLLLWKLLSQGVTIMATQAEAAAQLAALKSQLTKATTEIKAKIQALVDAAANAANVDPGLQVAIDDLAPIGQALDDIVPDTV